MVEVQTFLAMGGYAPFIWPAFGITVVVLLAVAVFSRRSLKSKEAILASLRRRTRKGDRTRGA